MGIRRPGPWEAPIMTRVQLGSLFTGLAGAGFLGTAALHGTGYDSVTQLAARGPAELQALAPALWLAFSLDLVIIGLILAVVARRPIPRDRAVLAVAALSPIGAALLQIRFLGFILPTAILLALGAFTLTAAVVVPPAERA